ncbi:TauD/TfdA family dioxygenase [Synechococcus sp. PCC 7336]|uniref:TauD/TfdA family dioxygenase n=1 Tax=Synechococcus sp. PCC 7336 TaxID=195250 RepID=UPI00034B4800|nr:TauD/TfdA family dioxygenase [Synechococcus sp. PCC 7336]
MHNASTQPKLGLRSRRQRGSGIQVSATQLVTTAPLQPDTLLPLVVSPAVEGLNLTSWAAEQRQWIQAQLWLHGGLLCRNFTNVGAETLESLFAALGGELMEYAYRSTPRSPVRGRIYTSTAYPASESIPLHNEMSYSRNWPMRIGFSCLQSAATGGETPIADSHKVWASLDPEIRDTFARKQVLYVRNYSRELDLPWQTVFQTEDRAAVEQYCRAAGIEWEWRSGDRLRTRQVCQAVAQHPQTQAWVWFNQAHLFHVANLPPETRQSLLAVVDEADLPRNTYYGDGTPIADRILAIVRAAYAEHTVAFRWQTGDILLLDNMLVAHGRRPFTGERQVVVGMDEPYDRTVLQGEGTV